MDKNDIRSFFELYFAEMTAAYNTNRYVSIDRKGFRPEEEELKKIIKQRVEGVDSLAHELNRRMSYLRYKMLEEK